METRHGRTVLDEDFFQAPHRHLASLRSRGPAHPVVLPNGLEAWIVTDHDQAKRLLTDPRLSKDRQAWARLMAERGPQRPVVQELSAMSSHLLACDPPDHTRLRALVAKTFTARRVGQMRTRVADIVEGLVDDLPTTGAVDLLDRVTYPLALTVIEDLLGIPEGNRDRFRRLVDTLFLSSVTPTDHATAAHDLLEFLRQLVVDARASPREGLLRALVEVRDGADRLSEDELVSMVTLLSAGYETTAHLIGSGVLALLCEPDALDALRDDPDLTEAAVEEALRFCSPVYLATPRFTTADVACGAVTIPAREIVFVSLLAANHDPGRFPSPDLFRIGRAESPHHLAFGHGVHFCVGSQLARLEAELVLRALVARFGEISLDVAPDLLHWRKSTAVHGLERLPVRLRTPAPTHPHLGS